MTDVVTTESANEMARTRYSGPVEIDFAGSEETIDTTAVHVGRGRPQIDLTPYKKVLLDNYRKNSKLPAESKMAWRTTVNSPAVSTVKSRFNSAGADMVPPVGITWLAVEEHSDGTSTVRLIAGKRIEGRGRPKGSVNRSVGGNAKALTDQADRQGR